MKKLLLLSFLFIVLYSFSQEKFQLAPPLLEFNSAFFAGSTSFKILFNQPGAEIRYTLNGNEPTANDLLYAGAVGITKSTVVKVKAIGKDFISSETVTAEFIRDGKAVQRIEFSAPNEFYTKAKKDILHDNTGGFTSFGGGTWIGYNSDSAEMLITLKRKEKIQSVLVDMLADEGSWIFLPEAVTVLYLDSKTNSWAQLARKTFQHDKQLAKKCIPYSIEVVKKIKTKQVKLVFDVLKKIPQWHPGKDSHAWFFIDEIKVY